MIAIFDNGGSYSDHSWWIVDIGDEDPKLIEKVARSWRRHDKPFLVLAAPSVEWFAGRAMTIDRMVEDFWWDDEDDLDGVDCETIKTLIRFVSDKTHIDLLSKTLTSRGAQ